MALKARTYVSYQAALFAIVKLGYKLPVTVAEVTEAYATAAASFRPLHEGDTATYYEVAQGDAVLGFIQQAWMDDFEEGVVSAVKML